MAKTKTIKEKGTGDVKQTKRAGKPLLKANGVELSNCIHKIRDDDSPDPRLDVDCWGNPKNSKAFHNNRNKKIVAMWKNGEVPEKIAAMFFPIYDLYGIPSEKYEQYVHKTYMIIRDELKAEGKLIDD